VIALRCTQKVRDRLHLLAELPNPSPPTSALGDWYVHIVQIGRQQIVLATSERSLLTVLLPARELRYALVPNLQSGARKLLLALAVPEGIVNRELDAMQTVTFARATNRRVLGSMNDFAFQLGAYMERTGDALELALRLSDTPMSAIGTKSDLGIPREIACQLLASLR
jgi:hypothetical protein